MTLSPCRTLQHVIHTPKCVPSREYAKPNRWVFKCFAEASKPKEENLKPTGKAFQLKIVSTMNDCYFHRWDRFLLAKSRSIQICSVSHCELPGWIGMGRRRQHLWLPTIQRVRTRFRQSRNRRNDFGWYVLSTILKYTHASTCEFVHYRLVTCNFCGCGWGLLGLTSFIAPWWCLNTYWHFLHEYSPACSFLGGQCCILYAAETFAIPSNLIHPSLLRPSPSSSLPMRVYLSITIRRNLFWHILENRILGSSIYIQKFPDSTTPGNPTSISNLLNSNDISVPLRSTEWNCGCFHKWILSGLCGSSAYLWSVSDRR